MSQLGRRVSAFIMAVSSEEHYNDSAFNYFLLFFLFIFLAPSTYVFARNRLAKPAAAKPTCQCAACMKRKREADGSPATRSYVSILKVSLLVIFWSLFVFLLFSVATANEAPAPEPYNPYAVLEISTGAANEEIKKAYRQQSLKYHPDRNPGNATAAEMYLGVQKAYETLTNELARSNWEKYGNPDGPPAIVIGIALPRWLVKGENNAIVLAVYFLFLIVLVPTVVSMWWRKHNKAHAETKPDDNSLKRYVTMMDQLTRARNLIEFVSSSEEYSQIFIRPSDDEALTRASKRLPEAYSIKKKPRLDTAWVRKVQSLLHVHLSRQADKLPEGLQEDLDAILRRMRPLVFGTLNAAIYRRFFVPSTQCLRLNQMLTQGCWEERPLMQLPHITEEMSQNLQSKKYKVSDVASFVALPKDKKDAFAEEEKLTSDQMRDIDVVAQQIPFDVYFSKFEFGVADANGDLHQTNLQQNSIITIEFELTRWREAGEGAQDQSSDLIVGDLNAQRTGIAPAAAAKTIEPVKSRSLKHLRSRKSKAEEPAAPDAKPASPAADTENKDKETQQTEADKKDENKEKEKVDKTKSLKKKVVIEPGRPVHSPFYPGERDESWYMLVGEQGGVFLNMIRIPNFSTRHEGKFMFQIPEQEKPGLHLYTVTLMCDSYLGCDQTRHLRMFINKGTAPKPQQQPTLPAPVDEDSGDEYYSDSGSESD
eukprot:TRINITY_DN1339_c0_g1_i2.p1 TRINITY_DN1339_c0_g1~~TRINITY_DN1339_c0_g1_i2.p1  ORF type:complete len:707 (+),score=229.08 TRINITY_DN1339_c0_g1_i2:151-2271(+)